MFDLKKTAAHLSILLSIQLVVACASYAAELTTRFAVVSYKDDAQLKEFNQELYLGKLSYYIQGTALTFQEEVKQKLDVIITRVQAVLDMRPANLKFNIVILDSEKDVSAAYKKIYGTDSDFLAFYSTGKNTLYISLENANLKVISHEIGHAVVENFFENSPPRKIHEVLAQFAEQHILD